MRRSGERYTVKDGLGRVQGERFATEYIGGLSLFAAQRPTGVTQRSLCMERGDPNLASSISDRLCQKQLRPCQVQPVMCRWERLSGCACGMPRWIHRECLSDAARPGQCRARAGWPLQIRRFFPLVKPRRSRLIDATRGRAMREGSTGYAAAPPTGWDQTHEQVRQHAARDHSVGSSCRYKE
ncbi:hypothetical protein LZ32DRAFT_308969 [Colletotrichum eremochloae]|nr:hypothetical protein LZ32DRAFT_308969 [Colletotrichum eremochloae]